ncbi:MAG: hypothetical protein ACE5GX_10450 [Thermoanaerobaculia bacterium]
MSSRNPLRNAFAVAALACSLSGPVAVAQDSESELRQEIEELKEGQRQINQQLQEIKRLLASRPAAAPSGPQVQGKVFDIGGNPTKGAATAQLTLVEFTDYQ